MAVNVNELIQEWRDADAQAIIDSYPFAQLQYQSAFPELYTPDLDWKSLEATLGLSVAADVVAFNSRSPRKGRPLPGTVSAGIPKIEVARDKVETDFNYYRKLQNDLNRMPNNTQMQRQLLDWIYDDATFVVNSVRARLEWIAKRISSTGEYNLTIVNNEAGVQTNVSVDFGIPSNQKVNAVTPWSNAANADPIADIRARQKAARAQGKILRYMTMDLETFENMVATAAFQRFAATYFANALNVQQLPDLQSANAALRRQNLPEIVIWDSFVNIEGKDGAPTAVSGWEPGAVVFHVSAQLGNTQYTTSADEFVNVGKASKMKSGIVLVKTWGEEDPITVITKGTAYATPVLNNAKDLHILSTLPATT